MDDFSHRSDTKHEFIYSALLGLVASITYLGSSYLLDPKVGYNTANIIGLVIDHFVNFFLQYELFIGHEHKDTEPRRKFFVKFTLGNIFSIAMSQLLFMAVHEWVKKHRPEFYKDGWRKHITLIRYLVGAVIYVCVSFPLRKYFMFSHK